MSSLARALSECPTCGHAEVAHLSGPCTLCPCPGFGRSAADQRPPDPRNAIRATEEQIRYLHALIDRRQTTVPRVEAHHALNRAVADGLSHDAAQSWIRKMHVRPESD